MRRAATRRAGGLTMLELAIVLAVLAVLGALALPALGARMQHQRLLLAAQTLAGDVAEARFEAARRGFALYVQTGTAAPGCWSIATTPDCGCDTVQACQMRRVSLADHPGVQLVAGAAARLDPIGAADGALEATLQSRRGESLRVEVSRAGRARICAGAGSWAQLPHC